MNRIFGPLCRIVHRTGLLLHLIFDKDVNQLILILEMLINGFLRHPQVLGDIVHRNALDAKLAKKMIGLLQYMLFDIHFSRLSAIGRKTMETFFNPKVS